MPGRDGEGIRWPHRRRPLVAIASGFALIATVATTAGAAVPHANGRLVFATNWAPDLGRGEVFSVLPDGTGTRDVSSTPQLSEESPIVSPDGARIAWTARSARGLRDLYVAPLTGRPASRITGGLDVDRARWSPDSRRIAFTAAPGGAYVVDADGTGLRRFELAADLPSWSPDSRSVAFTSYFDLDSEIEVADVDGTASRTLVRGEEPAWSPDGTRIAYRGNDGQGVGLAVIDAGGGVPHRIATTYPYRISWSPDGRSLAFSVDDADGTRAARVVSAAGGDEHAVAAGTTSEPVWSPDSSRIAVAVVRFDDNKRIQTIAVTNRDGSDSRAVLPQADIGLSAPSWSPDGRLYYSSVRFDNDFEIVSLDPVSGDRRPLTDDSLEDVEPAWSPDGRKLAFVRGPRDKDEDAFRSSRHVIGSIYVMNADGSGVRRLTRAHDDHSPTWSPDGRKLAFERNGVLYVRNLSGPVRLRRLTALPDESLAPAWSPDGRRIAFERWYDEDSAHSITMIPATGGRITRLTDDDADDRAPSWSPDGREIVFARDTGRGQQLYVVNGGTHRSTPLTAPRPCSDCSGLTDALAPTWSPDGGAIAFVRTQQDATSLNVVTRNGTQEWRLTETLADDLWPDWQAVRK